MLAVSVPARVPRWTAIEWYAASLVAAVITIVVAIAHTGAPLPRSVWPILALSGIALIAERQSVDIGPYTQTSISALPILFSAVVYGPAAGMIVAGVALVSEFRRPYLRWVIWTSSRMLVAGLAGTVALAVRGGDDSLSRLVVAVALASLTEAVTDASLTSLTVTLRHRQMFLETARVLARVLLATVPLYTSIISTLAYAYVELSPWAVLLFLAPAIAAHRLLTLYHEQRALANDLGHANEQLERAGVSFASALVSALDARDRYTAGHSAAVAIYGRDIATRLALTEREQQLTHLCGLLHDIGKVGLPAGILEKAGRLSDDERRHMEQHVLIGERILANVDGYAQVAKVVRHHHERVDGRGYPDGLTGEDIPLISRILAVADAYNAMTSERPYRRAMSSSSARMKLRNGCGTQFDERVVATFDEILQTASETYISGVRADFAIEAQHHDRTASRMAATAA